MVNPIRNALRDRWNRLLEIEDSTESILRGLTLGIFVGLLPLMGIQILFVVFLAVLARVSKISATLGVFITNPFTVLPIYALNLKVGLIITGRFSELNKVSEIKSVGAFAELGAELLFDFLLGSFVVAAIGATITYLVFRPILYRYHRGGKSRRTDPQTSVE